MIQFFEKNKKISDVLWDGFWNERFEFSFVDIIIDSVIRDWGNNGWLNKQGD